MSLKPLPGIQPVYVTQTLKPIQSLQSPQAPRAIQPLTYNGFRANDFVPTNPKDVNSFSDVFFNRVGRAKAYSRVFGGAPSDDLLGSLAETVASAVYHLQNSYVEPILEGDALTFVANSINAFGEDADLFSNLTKGMIIEAGTQESSLLYGALASVAALGLTMATGGTFAMAMSAGFIAGGTTAVGNAVLTDPEGAARGFERAAGFTGAGKYNYNFNLKGEGFANWVAEMYGEIAVDPLNWISFSATFAEKYAEKMARKAGTQFTTSSNNFLNVLNNIGKVDNVVTKAAFVSNPLGLALYGVYSGTKWAGSAAQRSIRTALLTGTVKDFLGLSEVFDNSYKVVKKELGQIRSTYATQLGFLKKSDDVYFQWYQEVQEQLMKVGKMSQEEAAEQAQALLHGFFTSKDYSFIGNMTTNKKIRKLYEDRINALVNLTLDVDATAKAGKAVSEFGGAADYVASNYKPGLDAVTAFVNEISSYSDSLNMLVKRINGDLDTVANEMISSVKSGIVGKSKAEYMYQAYQALAKVYPDINKGGFGNPKVYGSRFNAYVYATFFQPAGITQAEYLAFQKGLHEGKYSLEHPETFKDAIKDQIQGEVRTMSGFFRDSIEAARVLSDPDSEAVKLIKALGNNHAGTIRKQLFGASTKDVPVTSFHEAIVRGIKRHLTPEVQERVLARFNDPVIGKPMMEVVNRYAAMGDEEIIAEFMKLEPTLSKKNAEDLVKVIRNLSTIEGMVKNPDPMMKSLKNRASDLKKDAEAAKKPEPLLKKKIKKVRLEDTFISAYMDLSSMDGDKLFDLLPKSGPLRELFEVFKNFNAFNPTNLMGLGQAVELELRNMGAIALDVTQRVLDQIATEALLTSDAIKMFYEIMDEQQPLGRLFAYIANSPNLGIHPEFEDLYTEVRKIYATMKSFQHYIEFSARVKAITEMTVAIEPNRKIVTEMKVPVKVLQDTGATIRLKFVDGKEGEYTIDELMRNEEYAKMLGGDETTFTVFDADQIRFVHSKDVIQDIQAAGKITTDLKTELDELQIEHINRKTLDLTEVNVQLEAITRKITDLKDQQRLLRETAAADSQELAEQILGAVRVIDERVQAIDARLAQLDPDNPATEYLEEYKLLVDEKESLVADRIARESELTEQKNALADARRKVNRLEAKIKKQTQEQAVFLETVERKVESLSREFKRLEDTLTSERDLIKLATAKKVLSISDIVLKRAARVTQFVQDKNIKSALADLSKKLNVSMSTGDLYAQVQTINNIVSDIEKGAQAFKEFVNDETLSDTILNMSKDLYIGVSSIADDPRILEYSKVMYEKNGALNGPKYKESTRKAYILDVIFRGKKPVFTPDYVPEKVSSRLIPAGQKKALVYWNSVGSFVGFREYVDGRLLHNLFDDSVRIQAMNSKIKTAKDLVITKMAELRNTEKSLQTNLMDVQRQLSELVVEHGKRIDGLKRARTAAYIAGMERRDAMAALYTEGDVTKYVTRVLDDADEDYAAGVKLDGVSEEVARLTREIKEEKARFDEQRIELGKKKDELIEFKKASSDKAAIRRGILVEALAKLGFGLYESTDARYLANFSNSTLEKYFADLISPMGDFNEAGFIERVNKFIMNVGRPELTVAGVKTKNYSQVYNDQVYLLGKWYNDNHAKLMNQGMSSKEATSTLNKEADMKIVELANDIGLAKLTNQEEITRFLSQLKAMPPKFTFDQLDYDARRLVFDSIDKNGTHFSMSNFSYDVAVTAFSNNHKNVFDAYFKPVQELMAIFLDGKSDLWAGVDDVRLRETQEAFEAELSKQEAIAHIELQEKRNGLNKQLGELKAEQAKFEVEHLKDYQKVSSDFTNVLEAFRRSFTLSNGQVLDMPRYKTLMYYVSNDSKEWAALYDQLKELDKQGKADEWFDAIKARVASDSDVSEASYVQQLSPELRKQYMDLQSKIADVEDSLYELDPSTSTKYKELMGTIARKKAEADELALEIYNVSEKAKHYRKQKDVLGASPKGNKRWGKAIEGFDSRISEYVKKQEALERTLKARDANIDALELRAKQMINESPEYSLARARTRAWQMAQDKAHEQSYFIWDEAAIKSFLSKNKQFTLDDVRRTFYTLLDPKQGYKSRPVLIRNHVVPVAMEGKKSGLDEIGLFTKENLVHQFLYRGTEFYYQYPGRTSELLPYDRFMAELRQEWVNIKGMKRVHDKWYAGNQEYQPLIFGQRRTPFDYEKGTKMKNIPEGADKLLKDAAFAQTKEFKTYKQTAQYMKDLGYDSPAPFGLDVTSQVDSMPTQIIEPIKGFPLLIVEDKGLTKVRNISLLPADYRDTVGRIQKRFEALNQEIKEFEENQLKKANELNDRNMMTPGREVLVNELGRGKIISPDESLVFEHDYDMELQGMVQNTKGDIRFDRPGETRTVDAYGLGYERFAENQRALYKRSNSNYLFIRLDAPLKVKDKIMYHPDLKPTKNTYRLGYTKGKKFIPATKTGDLFVIPAAMDSVNAGYVGRITHIATDTTPRLGYDYDKHAGNTFRIEYEVYQRLHDAKRTLVPRTDIRVKYDGAGSADSWVRRADTIGTYEKYGLLRKKQERYYKFLNGDIEGWAMTNKLNMGTVEANLEGRLPLVEGKNQYFQDAPGSETVFINKDGDEIKLIPDSILNVLVDGVVSNFQYGNPNYYFLSNTYSLGKYSVKYEGMEYNTVEAAYQAAKFKRAIDRIAIQEAKLNDQKYPSGKAAKMLAQELVDKYKALPEAVRNSMIYTEQEWEAKKMDVMYGLLRQKFSIPEHMAALKATKDYPLVEGNTWNDNFWGMASPEGRNELGRMIMRIRGELGGTGEVPFRRGQKVYVKGPSLDISKVSFKKPDSIPTAEVKVPVETPKIEASLKAIDNTGPVRVFKPVVGSGKLEVHNISGLRGSGDDLYDQVSDRGIYVGRSFRGLDGSPLSNPFIAKARTVEEHTRVVNEYRVWLNKQLEDPSSPQSIELDRLVSIYKDNGNEIGLACWCAPLPCHADVLMEHIVKRASQSVNNVFTGVRKVPDLIDGRVPDGTHVYPDGVKITALGPNDVFVYGANSAGILGAGAAKQAKLFGAIPGRTQGGLSNTQTHALITKMYRGQDANGKPILQALDPNGEYFKKEVQAFIDVARSFKRDRYILTDVGTGLAGMDFDTVARIIAEQMVELGTFPPNIVFSQKMYDRVAFHFDYLAQNKLELFTEGPGGYHAKKMIEGLTAGLALITERGSVGASGTRVVSEVTDAAQAAIENSKVEAPKVVPGSQLKTKIKSTGKQLSNKGELIGKRYETHDEYVKRVSDIQNANLAERKITVLERTNFEVELKNKLPEVYVWYKTLTESQQDSFISNPEIPDVVADMIGDSKGKLTHTKLIQTIKEQGTRMLDETSKARTDYVDMLRKNDMDLDNLYSEMGIDPAKSSAFDLINKVEETLKATVGDTEEVRARIEEIKKRIYELVAKENERSVSEFKERQKLLAERKELVASSTAETRARALVKVNTEIGDLMQQQYEMRGRVFQATKELNQVKTVSYRRSLEEQALEKMFGPDYKKIMPLIKKLQSGDISVEEFVMLKNKADGIKMDNGEAIITRRFSRFNILHRIAETRIEAGRLVEQVMDSPERMQVADALTKRALDIISEVRALTPDEASKILGDNTKIKARFSDIPSDPDMDPVVNYLVQEIRNILDMNGQFESTGIRMLMMPDVGTQGSFNKVFSGLFSEFVSRLNNTEFQKDLYKENINRFMNTYITNYGDKDPIISQITRGFDTAKEVSANIRSYFVYSQEHLNKLKSVVGVRVGDEGARGHSLVLRYVDIGGRMLLEKHPELRETWDTLTYLEKEKALVKYGIDVEVERILTDRYAMMINRQTIREAETATIGSMNHAGKMEAITGEGSAVVPVLNLLDKELEAARQNLTVSIADALYNSQIHNRSMLSLVRDIEVLAFQSPRQFGVFGKREGYNVIGQRGIKVLKEMMNVDDPFRFAQVLKHHVTGGVLTLERSVLGDLDPRVVQRLLDKYGIEVSYINKSNTFAYDLTVIRFVNEPDSIKNSTPITGVLKAFREAPTELGVQQPDMLDTLFSEMQISAKQASPFNWFDVPTFRISDEHLPKKLFELGILTEQQAKEYASALQDSGVLGLSVLGGADFMSAMTGNSLPESPLRAMITSTTSLSKHSASKTKFIRLFFRPEYSLDAVFGSSNAKEVFRKLKSMPDSFEVLLLKEDLNIHRVTINSWKDVEFAMKNKAIVTNYPGFVKIYQALDTWKMPALLDWMERNLNSIFTSGVMTSPAMAVRNMLDNTVKLIAMAGGDLDSLAYIERAHFYMERFKEIALEMKDLQDGVAVVDHLSKMSEEDRMIYFLLTQAGEMRTSGAPMETYLDITEAARKARELRGVAKEGGSPVQDIMWGNPLTQFALEMQNWSEQRWRLAGYLYMMNKGKSASETAKIVAEYFIDYSVKNKALKVLKVLVPFSMFTVKNTLLWAEHAADTPWLYRTMIDAGTASWNQQQAEQDGYLNKAQQSAYISGNISLGKSVLKVNPSFFDAINAIPGLVQSPLGRITPVINNPIKVMSGDMDGITLPWEGVADKAATVAQGVNDLMQGNRVTPADFAPGMVSDLKQYTPRFTEYNSVNTRYASLTIMKAARKNYRSILRSSNYYRKNVFYSTVGRGFKPYKVPK